MKHGAMFLLALMCATPVSANDLSRELYCLQYPAECRGTGTHVLKFSKKLMRDLYYVNRKVNRSIVYRAEGKGYDIWQKDVRYGDCDDYVMTKRSELRKLGYSVNALRDHPTTLKGIGHLTLRVYTTHGVFELDNNLNRVRHVGKGK